MSKNKKLKRNATSAIAEVAFCPPLLHGIFNFSLKFFRAIEKKSKAIKTKKKFNTIVIREEFSRCFRSLVYLNKTSKLHFYIAKSMISHGTSFFLIFRADIDKQLISLDNFLMLLIVII